MLNEHRLGARCTIAKQQQRLFLELARLIQDMMVEAWLARADSLASQLARTIFFAFAEFRDFICRLRDDPDACHAYALRCAAKNSLNWRLTAERSLYIHGATSLCFRTRQLNTDDSLDPNRPTDNI